jgi:cytochrome c556
MHRQSVLICLTAALIVAACSEPPADRLEPRLEAGTQAAAGPSAEPGWTGVTEPEEVIEARRVLMLEAQRLMAPIDRFGLGEPVDPGELRANATSLEALLLALPHLFPPTTNRYDASVLEPPTVALPAIWERFPAFLTFAESAEHAAAALRDAEDGEALRDASAALRGACDACHAAFMKVYTPPEVRPEDLEFDFESVLPDE